jgi:hypothetical protein
MPEQLVLDVDAFLGRKRTKWIKGPPPSNLRGWFEVTVNPGLRFADRTAPRRWWNGQQWSWAVYPDDADDWAETRKHRVSNIDTLPVYYRGLTEPAPEGYCYAVHIKGPSVHAPGLAWPHHYE